MPFSKLSSTEEPFGEPEVSPGLNDPNWNDENCSTGLPPRILYVTIYIYMYCTSYLLVIVVTCPLTILYMSDRLE